MDRNFFLAAVGILSSIKYFHSKLFLIKTFYKHEQTVCMSVIFILQLILKWTPAAQKKTIAVNKQLVKQQFVFGLRHNHAPQ